jgi:replication-associated recombination protein RarA
MRTGRLDPATEIASLDRGRSFPGNLDRPHKPEPAQQIHGSGTTQRDEPLEERSEMLRRFVLTGAPGAGKTALAVALRDRGYVIVAEAATDVIAEELRLRHMISAAGQSRVTIGRYISAAPRE